MDGDEVNDCLDACPTGQQKTAVGGCGCGDLGGDGDADGVFDDCVDTCKTGSSKSTPGVIGCNA